MQFSVKAGMPSTQKTACALVPIFEGSPLETAAKELDKACGGAIKRAVRAGNASPRLGQATFLHELPKASPAGSVLLVGCGPRKQFNRKRVSSALKAAAQALRASGVRNAISYLGYGGTSTLDPADLGRLSVEAFRSVFYRFDELKSSSEPAWRTTRLGIAIDGDTAQAKIGIALGLAIADGMDLARDLGNRPPNVCTPSHLAETARDIAKSYKNFKIKVLTEREIKKLGMGALWSVTQGAEEPVRFIELSYSGGQHDAAPVVLCGKGVTFDTGGISLKPPPKMDEMKFDMCGAAGVLGAMKSLGEMQAPINVVALIPACENMPSGRATRPGDIVTSLSGKTIEILNTDAEGRLILCDALTYAKRFEPRYVVDVATLTGACVIALGPLYTGVFSNDDALADALVAAGQRSLDAAWHMPADDEYGESLKSNFADFANAGSREGGASVAAQFLSRFVEGMAWAHLDIAGVAWHANSNKGATGRPVPLLVDFLLALDAP
jgi:leucyl aminopeptidase